MIHLLRSFIIFVKLSILVILGIIIAQYPGRVHLDWLGYAVDTTAGVLIAAVLLCVGGLLLINGMWRFLWRLPVKWAESCRKRRRQKGEVALLEGICAVAAGEFAQAGQAARRARSLNPPNPLNFLLSAQSSYMAGNHEEAHAHFQHMAKRPETAFLGLRGLALLAGHKNDREGMRRHLQEALDVRPGSPWALQQLMELDLRLGDLDKASIVVEQMQHRQIITRQASRRRQALIHWLKAQSADQAGDENAFLQAAASAHYEAPEISAIAVKLADHYFKSSKVSKARKLLMKAYPHCPHSDFGERLTAYSQKLSPLDIYREHEKMTEEAPDHPESLFIMAQAARKAKLWGQARHFINQLKAKAYSQRVCRLMAELEESENPNQPAQARNWWEKAANAPADPGWVCHTCHSALADWQPSCPVCQSFDQISWQLPNQAEKKDPSAQALLPL